jgi:hypothetical protein
VIPRSSSSSNTRRVFFSKRTCIQGEINSLTNTQISAFVKLGVGSLEKGPALMERLPMELRKPKSRPVWVKHYASLCQFKEQCGHVTIPAKEPEYASLYLWTQKQLVEYRNYCNGVKSSLDENYLAKLKDVGLITEGQPVDSKFTPWSERFEELKAFKKEYGASIFFSFWFAFFYSFVSDILFFFHHDTTFQAIATFL